MADWNEWAKTNFQAAQLGDRRRVRRLIQVSAAIARNPHGTLPPALRGWAAAKGAYRLFENEEAVSHASILASHINQTLERCRQAAEVLLIEDTTVLSFSQRPESEGLGWVTTEFTRGLLVHSTLAVRIHDWNSNSHPRVTVEGLAGQVWWTRQGTPRNKTKEDSRERRRRHRESERWAAGIAAKGGAPAAGQWIFVADREADQFDLLQRCVDSNLGWVVRAWQQRRTTSDTSALEEVAKQPILGRFTLPLRSRPGQPARNAKLEIRATRVELRGPRCDGGRPQPLSTYLVEAREISKRKNAIHWLLYTSICPADEQQALRIVRIYAQRWFIEEYHKVLKTGTQIEKTQLSSAKRIAALMAIHAVLAAHLLNAKLKARHDPEGLLGGEVDPYILRALERLQGVPHNGWTWGNYILALAQQGGFLARKRDGPPGWLTIWRGLHALTAGDSLQRCG